MMIPLLTRRPAARRPIARHAGGFTLLEVMVAIAILGVALLALLGLHHQSLQSVIHAQDTTQAAMLAQALMTEAEVERFPALGTISGNFDQFLPGKFRDFRWQRNVVASGRFADVRKVQVVVFFGPQQIRRFMLTEFVHNPAPETGEQPSQGETP